MTRSILKQSPALDERLDVTWPSGLFDNYALPRD